MFDLQWHVAWLSWGSRKRQHHRPTKTWFKVIGTACFLLFKVRIVFMKQSSVHFWIFWHITLTWIAGNQWQKCVLLRSWVLLQTLMHKTLWPCIKSASCRFHTLPPSSVLAPVLNMVWSGTLFRGLHWWLSGLDFYFAQTTVNYITMIVHGCKSLILDETCHTFRGKHFWVM